MKFLRRLLEIWVRVNERVAVRTSAIFFTMEFFYLCVALVLIPLEFPATLSVVQFLSSSVIQLVALPLIGVSGVIVGRSQDVRAAKDHRALMYEVRTMKGLFARQEQLIKALHDKLEIDIEIDVAPDGEAPEADD